MERRVNPELASYMKEVNTVMMDQCGVSYSEIYPDLTGDLSAMRSSFEAGVPSLGFAKGMIENGGLVPVSAYGADAKQINSRRLALQNFSDEHPEWLKGAGGSVVKAHDDGTAYIIGPMKSQRGAWGFGVEMVEVATSELDTAGRVKFADNAPRELIGVGLDIEDATRIYADHNDARLVGAPKVH